MLSTFFVIMKGHSTTGEVPEVVDTTQKSIEFSPLESKRPEKEIVYAKETKVKQGEGQASHSWMNSNPISARQSKVMKMIQQNEDLIRRIQDVSASS